MAGTADEPLPAGAPAAAGAPIIDDPPPDDHMVVEPDDAADREVGPMRRCLVTRELKARETMLRFVVGPDGTLVPDLAARLPGRGMWLSARADVVNSPHTRQAFSRAARMRVDVPDDLDQRIESGLRARFGDLLGFARRAGQAVAGHTRAQEWLQGGRAVLIVQAADGSDEERARFLSGHRQVPVVCPLSAARLGAVFGRIQAVHVAVSQGKLAAGLRVEAERLAGVMPARPADVGPGGVRAARDEDGR